MLTEYVEEALARARYELIEDPAAPYYGEVPDLPGVWASGATAPSHPRAFVHNARVQCGPAAPSTTVGASLLANSNA